MPTHAWRCPKCRVILGSTNGRVLRIYRARVLTTDTVRASTLVTCHCNATRSFDGIVRWSNKEPKG